MSGDQSVPKLPFVILGIVAFAALTIVWCLSYSHADTSSKQQDVTPSASAYTAPTIPPQTTVEEFSIAPMIIEHPAAPDAVWPPKVKITNIMSILYTSRLQTYPHIRRNVGKAENMYLVRIESTKFLQEGCPAGAGFGGPTFYCDPHYMHWHRNHLLYMNGVLDIQVTKHRKLVIHIKDPNLVSVR